MSQSSAIFIPVDNISNLLWKPIIYRSSLFVPLCLFERVSHYVVKSDLELLAQLVLPQPPAARHHMHLPEFHFSLLWMCVKGHVCATVCKRSCVCYSVHAEVRGQLHGTGSLFPPLHEFQGLNTGHQACLASINWTIFLNFHCYIYITCSHVINPRCLQEGTTNKRTVKFHNDSARKKLIQRQRLRLPPGIQDWLLHIVYHWNELYWSC